MHVQLILLIFDNCTFESIMQMKYIVLLLLNVGFTKVD